MKITLHLMLGLVSANVMLAGAPTPPPAPTKSPATVTPLGASKAEVFKSGPAEAAARYARSDWIPIWQDEFSDDDGPSDDSWTYERGLIRNGEKQSYTVKRAKNARIKGDQLIITARREPWEGAAYTSASLTTKGKVPFLYGKIEVRAKIPTGRGAWPAIWLLGDTTQSPWPLCGEIDLMENVGFDPEKIHFTTHTGAFNHTIGTQQSRAITVEKPWKDFHRYGLIWTSERIEYFFDGEKVSEFVNDGRGLEHWPFNSPQWLILNLAIGGAWGGQKGIDDGIFPAEFRIDYVRYWRAPAK